MTPTPQQDVTAVIVNYGSARDTTELVNRLTGQVAAILVVDNSRDFARDSQALSGALLISPDRNLGFGAAINLAAQQLETRWLLVLNPDVRLKRYCVKHLLDASRQLHAPLCGPRFYWDDACAFELPPAMGHPLWLCSDRHIPDTSMTGSTDLTDLAIARHKRFWHQESPFPEPVLSGACLLFDHDWFVQNKTPLFDEDFFLYYEDTDLCGRLIRKGVMPVCVPAASAVHYWNQSAEPPEGKAALMQASEKVFMTKYYPQGAPSLPGAKPVAEITDLGSRTEAPSFTLPETASHLDIGVQDSFMLFARTSVSAGSFTLPDGLLKKMRPGAYFARAVDSRDNGLQYWRWQKTA